MEQLVPLTAKEIRYALIKGWAERRDYRKRPESCWPLAITGLTSQYINATMYEVGNDTEEDYYDLD